MSADLQLQLQLGKRCRAVRERRKMSLMDVVKHHEISLSHLQKIERGVLDPRLSTLRKLARAYGMTLASLLRGVGENG
jgi:transcriptional regulator with XRE-family HTH domain